MKQAFLLRTAIGSLSVAAFLAASNAAMADAMSDLVAAAKKEGQLTTIALPHDWCGYGAVIEAFKAKYPGIAPSTSSTPTPARATRSRPSRPTRATPVRRLPT